MSLRWEAASKSWPARNGGSTVALTPIDLDIDTGEFVALIGPSGCGKTTMLELAAGLETPTDGRVLLDGELITEPGPDRTLVFQEHHLFPWLRVRENVGSGLAFSGQKKRERRQRVDELLGAVGLSNFAEHLPHELSGGMRQRVALARALAVDPQVLLLDEPFAALDFQTRVLMQRFLLALWQRFSITAVFVTHHVDEALLLADRVVLVSAGPGRIVDEVTVTLPRPRDPNHPDFLKLRTQLTAHLEREVMAAAEPGMRDLLDLDLSTALGAS